MSKTIFVSCDCGCSILTINELDGVFYIDHYASSFYAGQRTIWREIKSRVKAIWHLALGKKFMLYEVVMDKDSFLSLREKINEFYAENINE